MLDCTEEDGSLAFLESDFGGIEEPTLAGGTLRAEPRCLPATTAPLDFSLPFETVDLLAVGEVLLVMLFSVSFPTDDFSGHIFAETVSSPLECSVLLGLARVFRSKTCNFGGPEVLAVAIEAELTGSTFFWLDFIFS